MKIVSLKIKNFRGYKDLTEIKFDNLTVFVGKMILENRQY